MSIVDDSSTIQHASNDVDACRMVGSVLQVSKDLIEWTVPDILSFRRQRKNSYFSRSPYFWFSGHTWCLRLYIYDNDTDNRIGMSISLCIGDLKAYSSPITLNATFGLKTKDGRSENILSWRHTFDSVHPVRANAGSVLLTEKYVLRSHLGIGESLTIIFRPAIKAYPAEAAPLPLELTDLGKLSWNFGELLASKKKCDVVLKVKGKEFEAHRAILMARSPVFAAMFEHDLSESQTGIVTVPDCDPDSFGSFLQYLYTGKFCGITTENAQHLYVIADKYDVPELKWFSVAYLERNVTIDNFFDIVSFADRYDQSALMSFAQSFFNMNMKKILSMTEWMTLLRTNCHLANRLLQEMASKIEF